MMDEKTREALCRVARAARGRNSVLAGLHGRVSIKDADRLRLAGLGYTTRSRKPSTVAFTLYAHTWEKLPGLCGISPYYPLMMKR